MLDVPAVNAEIRGTDIVYHGAVHLGIAVGTPRGLVVPVVRDAHALRPAGLEREVGGWRSARVTATDASRTLRAARSRSATAASTVRCSPHPSSIRRRARILGMHKIEKRPIVEGDDRW
jgi:2-oxoglutarate dehydrogenase E2 component (dihydrolipoamide succinyltransferase)